ncbi:hypothetical protein CMV_019256 [Castanea mollissima]|uniref:Uncharacterized protein n=1 Tax=Castanea mollissima TaxID=60419 RepID=A0A8J4QK33_9ROSI|nr:hypothetical protein CMV_019256 [Castanea mollissima]
MVVQDQPSATIAPAVVSEEGNHIEHLSEGMPMQDTEVVSWDGHQNNHFPEELPMEVTGDGDQNSVIFVHRQNSNLGEPTPTFEEQLQQIDKALSVDCVSPILSAGNPNVVGVKLDSSYSIKSHVDQNKFTPN